MQDRETIEQLRKVRQQREQRAREAVLRRQSSARKAEARAQQAADAIASHLERVAIDEQAAFSSLVGRATTTANLHRLQSHFRRVAEQRSKLEDDERAANSEAEQQKAELAEARDDHYRHAKALAKLDGLCDLLKTRLAHRETALAELSDDEDRGS